MMKDNEKYFSVMRTDLEILNAISQIYLDRQWFDYDPTFSKGTFYQGVYPVLKSDLIGNELTDFTCDFTKISLEDKSLKSIVFDPPFIFQKIKKECKTKHNMMGRFSYYQSWNGLISSYTSFLSEAFRLLKRKGILAFKCQDYTNSKLYPTHINVFNIATNAGFICEDIFIKHNKSKLYNPNHKQRHALKTHCYWYVFLKKY